MTQAENVSADAVRACHDGAGPGETAPACLGQAAQPCHAGGNGTTLQIAECIQAETNHWDTLLNENYAALRDDWQERGTLNAKLRDAQRAWIAFRDAECALEYARWQGGSIRRIVAANCMLVETAARAIALRDKRAK